MIEDTSGPVTFVSDEFIQARVAAVMGDDFVPKPTSMHPLFSSPPMWVVYRVKEQVYEACNAAGKDVRMAACACVLADLTTPVARRRLPCAFSMNASQRRTT